MGGWMSIVVLALVSGEAAPVVLDPEVSRLLVMLEGDERSRRYAVEELRRLGAADPIAEQVGERLTPASTPSADALGHPAAPAASPTPAAQRTREAIGEDQVKAWIGELRDANPHIRWGAVSELGRLSVVEAIPEIVAGIVRCRDHAGDWHVYWRSLWALNNMPEPKVAVPLAMAAFASAQDWHDRWNAAVAICYLAHNDPGAVAFLHQTLAEQRPVQLRAFSITALAYARSDTLFAAVERFGRDPDRKIRGAVLDALRHWDDDDLRRAEAMIPFLDDPEKELRWRAAMHLGRRRTDQVVAALTARLEVETDGNVRKHILNSLARHEQVERPTE